MKFVADVMLGRLAKRMRLLGFDVLYDQSLDDNEIIRLSLEQHRLILTRDTVLAARPLAAGHLFIENDDVGRQLHQVLSAYPPEPLVFPLSRCSHCNVLLAAVSKEEVKDRVPNYVYQKSTIFHVCETCGRVYWTGSHVKKMGLRKTRDG
jgi:uncharacterized protein with PIN domain